MKFKVVGQISSIETIAEGHGIRELARLRRIYGSGNWKKKKGVANVKWDNGSSSIVELHWYEAHGLGRREEKVKAVLRET